jgi:excinuclease UvrABC nuclease subunit
MILRQWPKVSSVKDYGWRSAFTQLIIIDGGKGQLSAALKDDLGLRGK